MAKAKALAPKRRAHEYDHEYGLPLTGKAVSKGGGTRTSQGATASRPAKAKSTKRSAKKR